MALKASKRDQDRLKVAEELRQQAEAGALSPKDSVSAEGPTPGNRVQGAAVGRMIQTLGDGLNKEMEEAKTKAAQAEAELERIRVYEQMAERQEVVLLIPTEQIAPTRFSNRIEAAYTSSDPDFVKLLEDIKQTQGNVTPALVVRTSNGDGHDFELVYGHRRFHACQQLGLPLKAVVGSLTPDEITSSQTRENNHRAGLSSIEQGLQVESYLRLSRNDNGNQPKGAVTKLAASLNLKPRHVNKLSLIGRIPSKVLTSIGDYRKVPFRSATSLAELCRDDLKRVEQRLSSLPPDLSPRKRVEFLLDVGKADSAFKSGEYTIALPKDKETRDRIVQEIRALESKYDLKLLRKAVG